MKKTMCLILVGMGAAAFAATEFPYGVTEMTERNRSRSAEVVSFAEPAEIEKVSDMPETDALATVTAAKMTFIAASAANWEASVARVGSSQAGLAIKYENGGFHWMGATANGWVELTGVAAAEGEWDVKIDIDYSLGAGKRKVRYTVGGTTLTAGGAAWLPLGVEATTIDHVRLYGEGQCGTVVAKSAEREMQGTFTPSEDFGMGCNNLKVDINLEDAWGIDTAEVSLRDAFGEVVATKSGTVDGDKIRVDFTDVEIAGGQYTYEVRLSGDYNGKQMGMDITDIPPLVVGRDVGWFSFTGTGFAKATPTDITIDGGVFAANDGKTGKVNPNEVAPDKPEVILETTLDIQGVYQWEDLPEVTPQFAICLARMTNAVPTKLGVRTWACKNGEGKWEPAAVEGLFTDNGLYDVKVVCDYRDGQKKGVYWVRQHGGEEYLKLAEFALSEPKLNRAAVVGGNVNALVANYMTATPVEVTPVGDVIAISGNSDVDLGKLTTGDYTVEGVGRKSHLRWTDQKESSATVKYAKLTNGKLTVISGAPLNGLDSYHSYVLGLDPEDELGKPVAVLKDDAEPSADSIEVYVKNVNDESALPQSGYEVRFRRQVSTDGGANWADDGDSVGVGKSLTIPLDGKLYRVKTILR